MKLPKVYLEINDGYGSSYKYKCNSLKEAEKAIKDYKEKYLGGDLV